MLLLLLWFISERDGSRDWQAQGNTCCVPTLRSKFHTHAPHAKIIQGVRVLAIIWASGVCRALARTFGARARRADIRIDRLRPATFGLAISVSEHRSWATNRNYGRDDNMTITVAPLGLPEVLYNSLCRWDGSEF